MYPLNPLFRTKQLIKENLTNGFEVMKPWDTNEFTFENGNQHFVEIPFIPDEKTLQDLLEDTLHAKVEIIDRLHR